MNPRLDTAILDTLVHHAPVGFAYLDRELRFVRVNDKLAEMNGIPGKAHIGRMLREIAPHLEPSALEATRRIVETGEAVVRSDLRRGPSRGGEVRYWNESWYPVRDDRGELTGFCAILEEVTARKRAEEGRRAALKRERIAAEKVQANETLVSAVLEHMPIALAVIDRDGRYLLKNERMERFSLVTAGGAGSPAAHGRWHAYYEDGRRIPRSDYPGQRALRGTVETGLDFLYVEDHGTETWTRVSAAPLRDARQNITGAIVLIQDINDLKQAEAKLRASEERLRLAIDTGDIGTWDIDLHTGRSVWNANRFRMLGYAVAPDHEGSHEMWLSRVHPEDRERVLVANREARSRDIAYWNEYRIIRADDGKTRWLLAASRAVHDPNGVPVRVIGVAYDITERKRLEQALRDSAAALEAADRRKDEFLAMLAHELRNPLAPILNAVSVFRMHGPTAPHLIAMRDIIERQVRHLARLVDDLMDVARVTRGNIALKCEPLEAYDVVNEALETVHKRIEARRQSIHLTMAPDMPPVHGDRTRLVQVVGNLLSNASKYTDEGGSIRVSVEEDRGEIVIRVSDTGIGIEADFLPHVFGLFTQAHRGLDRAQGGLGIGLSLVKSIVELHGGCVHAASDGPGRGSTFTVRLPVRTGDASPGERPGRLRQTARPRKVLVVDDNVDQATTLAAVIELAGHEVQHVHDGPSALEAATSFDPEVVLLDLGLPGLTGYEVARQLRRDPGAAGKTLVALTGYGQAEDREASAAAGFDHHLVKPVDADRLLTVIANAPVRR